MRLHLFYPRTNNIGDHFVQQGIERMVHRIRPDATFQLFNVNSRGEEKIEVGLTEFAIERANTEADLIIVGGSNLYEGSYRWPWGVHLDVDALNRLRVPLFLLGIGSGSGFGSPLHKPSARARREIKLLNECAAFSGARDVITFEWLQRLGITKAIMTGDPAAFIFNYPLANNPTGHILITIPPRRFWTGKRQLWSVHTRGRAMFRSLVRLARTLLEDGHRLVMACNDPTDLPIAELLFGELLLDGVVCPETPEAYFEILSRSRAVVSGRLHTAVAAFSLGIPFVLLDCDQRTHGFVKTHQLERWSVPASLEGIESRLKEKVGKLLNGDAAESWEPLINERDQMHSLTLDLLRGALKSIS